MDSPQPHEHRSDALLRAHHAAASPVLRYSAAGPVRVDGWLAKEGKATRTRRTRFVRLHGHVLTSHRSKPAPPSWHVSVAHAVIEKGPLPREIRLSLPHRVLSFVAPSDRAFDEWIVGLRRASLVSSRVEDYYRIGRLIGEGMNGQVRLARDSLTDNTVAVKMVPRLGRENETQFLAREVQIILSLSHPNIVRTIDVFVRTRRIHFVMEFLAGGELFDFIAENTNFTEVHAATVMADLLRALSYLHARGIAHRDVKLENLLCANTSWPLDVKLADFGFANYIGPGPDPVLSSFVGTPYYIAPEMLRANAHGRPVDVWASGVVLYILLSGKFPFGGKNETEYYQRVLTKEAYFPSEEWADVSDDAKDLVRGMLCKDPKKRLTADQCLSHPWLKRAQTRAEAQAEGDVFPADAPFSQTRPGADVCSMDPADSQDVSTAAVPESGYATMPGRDAMEESLLGRGDSRAKVAGKNPVLRSPSGFRDNREKRGKWRYLGMLNHSISSPNDAMLASREVDKKAPRKALNPTVPVDRAVNRGSDLLDEILAESADDSTVNRRPSLIRRLLSSGKLSLDRYEGRFPSFRGGVDDPSDEGTAQPRKTLSIFAKDGPLRRSFHRGGENRAADDGINFVNSQSQRLPPKIARERQRQAEALRKTSRGGIFSHRKMNGHNVGGQNNGGYHSSPRLQTPVAHPFSSVPPPPGQRGANTGHGLMSGHLGRRRFSAAGSRDQDEESRHTGSNGSSCSNMCSIPHVCPPDDGSVRRTMSADVSPVDRLSTSQFLNVEVLSTRLQRGR